MLQKLKMSHVLYVFREEETTVGRDDQGRLYREGQSLNYALEDVPIQTGKKEHREHLGQKEKHVQRSEGVQYWVNLDHPCSTTWTRAGAPLMKTGPSLPILPFCPESEHTSAGHLVTVRCLPLERLERMSLSPYVDFGCVTCFGQQKVGGRDSASS